LDCEAIQNRVSARIGFLLAMSAKPAVSIARSRSLLQTSITAHASDCFSTNGATAAGRDPCRASNGLVAAKRRIAANTCGLMGDFLPK
jgi:hypothetical protein